MSPPDMSRYSAELLRSCVSVRSGMTRCWRERNMRRLPVSACMKSRAIRLLSLAVVGLRSASSRRNQFWRCRLGCLPAKVSGLEASWRTTWPV